MVSKIRNQDGNDEWHGQLVDFDGSGQVGDARYPPTLNKDIRWPCGVEAGYVVEKRHDLDMLDARSDTQYENDKYSNGLAVRKG